MNEGEKRPTDDVVIREWGSRSHVQILVLVAVTALGIYLCYRLALPFLAAVVWALALAVVVTPFQGWVESKVKHPNMAAAVSVLVIGLIVLGLTMFVGERLIQEAANGAELIKTKVESGEWRRAIEARPRIAPLADKIERHIDLPGTVQSLAAWLAGIAKTIVKGSVVQIIGFLLTFYMLFFFLRDRREGLQMLRSLSPLSNAEMDRLLGRVGDTIFATIYGTLAVAAVQVLLGGLMFWWLGLPAPLLWGVMMALLAVVPVLGAFVVWIPAAVLLAMQGSWGKALILAVWGAAVVGTIDNLLRPILVGKRLKLHTALAFVSLVGGVVVFGAHGIVLGPVTLTVTVVLLEIWQGRTADDEAFRATPERRDP